jgi:hypothetical protein
MPVTMAWPTGSGRDDLTQGYATTLKRELLVKDDQYWAGRDGGRSQNRESPCGPTAVVWLVNNSRRRQVHRMHFSRCDTRSAWRIPASLGNGWRLLPSSDVHLAFRPPDTSNLVAPHDNCSRSFAALYLWNRQSDPADG